MVDAVKIRRIFAMEWSELIQYRFDLLLWMTSEAIIPLVSLAVWYTVASSSSSGPTPQDIFTYYVFAIYVIIVTNAWGGFFLSRQILDGTVVQHLIRPFPMFWFWIANNINEKILKLFIPLPALLLALVLFRPAFTPAIYEPANITLFLISLLLAAILHFNLDMSFGLIAFWLEDALQIRQYFNLLHVIASGVLIPFSFMPPLAQQIFSWLPFRYYIAAPIELLLGQIPTERILSTFGIQIAWTVIMFGLTTLLWKKGLKRYTPPGQ